MIYWGGPFQKTLTSIAPEMSVREFVKFSKRYTNKEKEGIEAFLAWATEHADSPQYFDRAIRMVGVLAVTRRQVWMDFLRASSKGDKIRAAVILQEFWNGEQKLAQAINPYFYRQFKEAQKLGDVVVIEFGCGLGQFTEPWARHVLEQGGEYFAFDQSPAAVAETKNRFKLVGMADERFRIRQGSTDDIEKLMKNIYHDSHYFLFPDIRLDLHITQPDRWLRFMNYIGKFGYRVLHAQTSADYLSADRPKHKGTVFHTQAEVTRALNMVPTGAPKVCDHHGDPFVVTDYIHPDFAPIDR